MFEVFSQSQALPLCPGATCMVWRRNVSIIADEHNFPFPNVVELCGFCAHPHAAVPEWHHLWWVHAWHIGFLAHPTGGFTSEGVPAHQYISRWNNDVCEVSLISIDGQTCAVESRVLAKWCGYRLFVRMGWFCYSFGAIWHCMPSKLHLRVGATVCWPAWPLPPNPADHFLSQQILLTGSP